MIPSEASKLRSMEDMLASRYIMAPIPNPSTAGSTDETAHSPVATLMTATMPAGPYRSGQRTLSSTSDHGPATSTDSSMAAVMAPVPHDNACLECKPSPGLRAMAETLTYIQCPTRIDRTRQSLRPQVAETLTRPDTKPIPHPVTTVRSNAQCRLSARLPTIMLPDLVKANSTDNSTNVVTLHPCLMDRHAHHNCERRTRRHLLRCNSNLP